MNEDETGPMEDKARAMGWVEQEEWKGDPSKWRPAEEFVQRGENIGPIMRDRINKLEGDLKIALKSNTQELKKVREESYNKAKAEYEEKLEKLDSEEFEAFTEGDEEKYKTIKKKRETLKAPVKDTPVENKEFIEWSEKNPWYKDDNLLRRNADIIAAEEVEKNPTIDPAKLYGIVEARIKEEFAHKFTNPNRKEDPSVESGEGSPPKGKNTFASLPKEAKDSFTRLAAKMKQSGREYTKEQFVEAYYE